VVVSIDNDEKQPKEIWAGGIGENEARVISKRS
jgi:hypothetical protein